MGLIRALPPLSWSRLVPGGHLRRASPLLSSCLLSSQLVCKSCLSVLPGAHLSLWNWRSQALPVPPGYHDNSHVGSCSPTPSSSPPHRRTLWRFPSNRPRVGAPAGREGGSRASWWCGPILAPAPGPWGLCHPMPQPPLAGVPQACCFQWGASPPPVWLPWCHLMGILLPDLISVGIRALSARISTSLPALLPLG